MTTNGKAPPPMSAGQNQINTAMETKIENGKLIIAIPLTAPRPSASGKTLVVATTGGNILTSATIDGKPVTVGVNAYIRR